MTTRDCIDKIRFSLSDKSGSLKFDDFDIDEADCRHIADELKKLLVNRPLAEIDAEEIRQMSCPGEGYCLQAVADVIAGCQRMFVHEKE